MQPRQQFDEAERQWLAPPARQSASSERMILRARNWRESREQRASQRSRATTRAKTLSKSNGRREVQNTAASVIHRKKAAFEA